MDTTSDRTAGFPDREERREDSPSAPVRAYRLVLLGPPGAGKGTQAEMLSRRLGTCHLSTGEVFRNAGLRADPSPVLKAALDAIKRGELVADELVISMVAERTGCLHDQGGFVLDGFPRTVAQAEALDQILKSQEVALDAVVSYELPLVQIIDRLQGRRTCGNCQAVYHVTARPPRAPGVCDQCGGVLVQRDDDRPESIRVRMHAYEESTRPLADYYRASGRLVEVSASGTPEEVFERTLKALGDRVSTDPA